MNERKDPAGGKTLRGEVVEWMHAHIPLPHDPADVMISALAVVGERLERLDNDLEPLHGLGAVVQDLRERVERLAAGQAEIPTKADLEQHEKTLDALRDALKFQGDDLVAQVGEMIPGAVLVDKLNAATARADAAEAALQLEHKVRIEVLSLAVRYEKERDANSTETEEQKARADRAEAALAEAKDGRIEAMREAADLRHQIDCEKARADAAGRVASEALTKLDAALADVAKMREAIGLFCKNLLCPLMRNDSACAMCPLAPHKPCAAAPNCAACAHQARAGGKTWCALDQYPGIGCHYQPRPMPTTAAAAGKPRHVCGECSRYEECPGPAGDATDLLCFTPCEDASEPRRVCGECKFYHSPTECNFRGRLGTDPALSKCFCPGPIRP